MPPSDTTDAAHRVQREVLSALGPSARMALAAEMSEGARRIAVEGELRRHPELTRAQAKRIVCERQWGAELAARVAAASPRPH